MNPITDELKKHASAPEFGSRKPSVSRPALLHPKSDSVLTLITSDPHVTPTSVRTNKISGKVSFIQAGNGLQ